MEIINTSEFIKLAQEYQKGKICNKCGEHKPFSHFDRRRANKKDGRGYICKPCAKVINDNKCCFKKWFITKRSDAKKAGLNFTIEPEDIPGVKIRETVTLGRNRGNGQTKRKYYSWEGVEYPKICPVFKIPLDWGMNGNQPNSPSLDRMNSDLHYVFGNVMIMSRLANAMKQNATEKQLKQFARYFLFGGEIVIK